jgi:hypothetical protein
VYHIPVNNGTLRIGSLVSDVDRAHKMLSAGTWTMLTSARGNEI